MKSINWFITVILLLPCNIRRGETCEVSESGFDGKTKTLILDLHNKARQKVANGQQIGQPSGGNIKELHWNEELAVAAQSWAETCADDHPPMEQKMTKSFQYYGQNYYGGFTSEHPSKHVELAMKMWFDEVKFLNPRTVSSYDGNSAVYGHYITIVWGETDSVGCGYVRWATDQSIHIFCDYGPSNYYVGSPIYKVGPPASKCKNGASTSYSGLCK
uniref:Cysteine-rich venom protein n=1 Tax=Hemiscolopendra marginata TaxID=943146 RepID=A0A646QCK6_9MYRI